MVLDSNHVMLQFFLKVMGAAMFKKYGVSRRQVVRDGLIARARARTAPKSIESCSLMAFRIIGFYSARVKALQWFWNRTTSSSSFTSVWSKGSYGVPHGGLHDVQARSDYAVTPRRCLARQIGHGRGDVLLTGLAPLGRCIGGVGVKARPEPAMRSIRFMCC